MGKLDGYAGKWLRVDLAARQITEFTLDEATLRKHLGGVGVGAKILYEEVPPGVEWSDPQNRLILATGPLNGTRVRGSGSFCVVTKGAQTDGATSVQANGFFGAFLKFAGFDGIVIQGRADNLCYLYIHDGKAEIRDAHHLAGKDTWETEDIIKEELGVSPHAASVFSIGPAGENLVRFACIVGDRGHVAAHNGPGAVMGLKNLKAVAVVRGRGRVQVHDRQKISSLSDEMFDRIKSNPSWNNVRLWGMLWSMTAFAKSGIIPVKNYTTNEFVIEEDELKTFSPQYLRERFELQPHPCWACQMNHCNLIRIPDGPHAGYKGEEPEYESYAALGPAIGNYDGVAATVLANETDRMGMDANETGWVLGLAIECYEKGILTKEDTGGLEMTWGNVEAARAMLRRIASRQGLGDVLAEGAMRAAQRIGKDAPLFAVHTMKGATPRSHDHRAQWIELFDTCVSNTGTIEADIFATPPNIGLPALSDRFSHKEVASLIARGKGLFQLTDSLVVCKLANRELPDLLVGMLNAATGWDFTWEEAMEVGKRAVNLLRAFNIRHGHTPDMEAPSPRYGSTPTDGPAKNKAIMPVWQEMLSIYYNEMGWDRATGKPKPETLERLGLASIIPDLWA